MTDIETKICPDCFTDKYKQQMPWPYGSEKHRTKCPSCGSQQNTYLHIPFNNEKYNTDIIDFLKNIFSCYEIDISEDGDKEYLATLIKDDFNLFSSGVSNEVQDTIFKIITDGKHSSKNLYKLPVYGSKDKSNIIKTVSWEEFSKSFSDKNRYFYGDEPSINFVRSALRLSFTEIPNKEKFFRARYGEITDKPKNFFPPPTEKTFPGGRANPSGMPYLYLASSEKVAILEMRPGIRDRITVANFILREKILVVDITQDTYPDYDPNPDDNALLVSIWSHRFLRGFRNAMYSPASATEQNSMYIPTQVMAELVKSMECHGIFYSSAMLDDPNSKNLVLFPVTKESNDIEEYDIPNMPARYIAGSAKTITINKIMVDYPGL